jgi:hypothetical protein
MVLNSASDIMLGEVPVQAVYCGESLIWSRNHAFSPPYPSIPAGTYTVGQSVQLLPPKGYGKSLVMFYFISANLWGTEVINPPWTCWPNDLAAVPTNFSNSQQRQDVFIDTGSAADRHIFTPSASETGMGFISMSTVADGFFLKNSAYIDGNSITSLSLSITASIGNDVIAAVTTRSPAAFSDGWKIIAETGTFSTSNQRLYVLKKTAENGVYSQEFYASAARNRN